MAPDPKRITDLTPIDGDQVANEDLFVIVDVDDSTMNVDGTTKSLNYAEFRFAIRSALNDLTDVNTSELLKKFDAVIYDNTDDGGWVSGQPWRVTDGPPQSHKPLLFRVAVSDSTTTGTYQLQVDDAVTADIAFDASSLDIQAALETALALLEPTPLIAVSTVGVAQYIQVDLPYHATANVVVNNTDGVLFIQVLQDSQGASPIEDDVPVGSLWAEVAGDDLAGPQHLHVALRDNSDIRTWRSITPTTTVFDTRDPVNDSYITYIYQVTVGAGTYDLSFNMEPDNYPAVTVVGLDTGVSGPTLADQLQVAFQQAFGNAVTVEFAGDIYDASGRLTIRANFRHFWGGSGVAVDATNLVAPGEVNGGAMSEANARPADIGYELGALWFNTDNHTIWRNWNTNGYSMADWRRISPIAGGVWEEEANIGIGAGTEFGVVAGTNVNITADAEVQVVANTGDALVRAVVGDATLRAAGNVVVDGGGTVFIKGGGDVELRAGNSGPGNVYLTGSYDGTWADAKVVSRSPFYPLGGGTGAVPEGYPFSAPAIGTWFSDTAPTTSHVATKEDKYVTFSGTLYAPGTLTLYKNTSALRLSSREDSNRAVDFTLDGDNVATTGTVSPYPAVFYFDLTAEGVGDPASYQWNGSAWELTAEPILSHDTGYPWVVGVTPSGVGQFYRDENTGFIYTALGLTSGDWTLSGSDTGFVDADDTPYNKVLFGSAPPTGLEDRGEAAGAVGDVYIYAITSPGNSYVVFRRIYADYQNSLEPEWFSSASGQYIQTLMASSLGGAAYFTATTSYVSESDFTAVVAAVVNGAPSTGFGPGSRVCWIGTGANAGIGQWYFNAGSDQVPAWQTDGREIGTF